MSSPLVSICVPTYNNAKYLRQCLDSIVSQTYKNIEVSICDDASTDETVEIIRDYANRYGFVLHKNPINMGGGAASSVLVQLAKGEYIAVYHSDDLYEPTIIEESVKVLNADPSVGLVGTMATIIDDEGRQVGEFRLHDTIKKLNKSTYSFDDVLSGILQNAATDIMLVTPSIMSRKKIYQELGTFNAIKYKSAYDYEMWLRIATKYPVAILDKKLMRYRVHKNQISELQIRKNTDIQDIVWVLRDYRPHISNRKIESQCSSLLDKWIFRTAKRQNQLGYFEKSAITLNYIQSKKYFILRWMLKIANTIGFRILKRTN